MDDHQFLQDLKTDEDRRDEFMDSAAAFIRMKNDSIPPQPAEEAAPRPFEKQAGLEPRQVAKYGLPAAMGIGAGLLSYLGTRKAPGSEKSKAEEQAQGVVDLADRKPKERQGFLRRIGGDTARFTRDVSKTYADNPKASTALSTALGAITGHTLARALGAK